MSGLIKGPNGGAVVGLSGGGLAVNAATPASSLSTTFNIENVENATSPTLVRIGMPFKKGDVPSGMIPKVSKTVGGTEITNIQFDQRVTWNDGSLKFCVCHFRDTDLTALEDRSYTLEAKSGSFSNTGTFSLSDIKTDSSWEVELTNVYEASGDRDSSVDTTNLSSDIGVNWPSHGFTTGAKAYMEMGSGQLIGGINTGTADGVNPIYTLTVDDTDNFSLAHPSETATSTDSGTRWVYVFDDNLNNHTLAFDDTLETSTYAYKCFSGPVCDGWVVWQFAEDDVALTDDDQMIGVWYINAWNDGTDTTNGNIEAMCKLTRPIYDVAGKTG